MFRFAFLFLVTFVSCLQGVIAAPSAEPHTFTNPVFVSQDPWVTRYRGVYYYSESRGGSILVRASRSLTGLAKAVPVVVWTAPKAGPNSVSVWAPEIHRVDGSWYIYYAAKGRVPQQPHHIYVLQSISGKPLGPYKDADTGATNGQLVTEGPTSWAIDPDVFTAADGHNYITWSGNPGGGPLFQCIYIARLKDPLHVDSSSVQISAPTQPWEYRTAHVNEGPVGFVHDGITEVMYSASASWTLDYCEGLLICKGPILDVKSWHKIGPILDHHAKSYGPGSMVFVKSPDNTQTWMLYHGEDHAGPAYPDRDIRMQQIHWNNEGVPVAGYPIDPGVPVHLPSGDEGHSGWSDSWSGTPQRGDWQFTNSRTASCKATSGMAQVFRGNQNAKEYSLTASIAATGKSGEAGIYPCYYDADNYVLSRIDIPGNRLITTCFKAGRQVEIKSTTLSKPINDSSYTVGVDKSNSTLTISIDGRKVQTVSDAPYKGQFGLCVSKADASFSNVRYQNSSAGWGDAYGDLTEGVQAGYQTGIWKILGDRACECDSMNGSVWQQIFRGNPNLPDYTVSVQLKAVKTGTTAHFPKYGLYACYSDKNNNVSCWIDLKNHVIATNGIVNGVNMGWQNSDLPLHFNGSIYHTLTVTKAGDAFYFALDGETYEARDFKLANGQPGLVTEDMSAAYQDFKVTPFVHE